MSNSTGVSGTVDSIVNVVITLSLESIYSKVNKYHENTSNEANALRYFDVSAVSLAELCSYNRTSALEAL